jgi:hypothetical protein
MKKTIFQFILLLSSFQIFAQNPAPTKAQIYRAIDNMYETAKTYSFNLNGKTVSGFWGPCFFCNLTMDQLGDDNLNRWNTKTWNPSLYWYEKPIGSNEKENKYVYRISNLQWETMLPIVETHPEYLPEDLVKLTISFPIQFNATLTINDDKENKVEALKEFDIYVHKVKAASLKKAIQALSNIAKKENDIF